MNTTNLKRWWQVYNGDKEKRFFVGKDGNSGLIRKKDPKTGNFFEWRTTDRLSLESGLSKTETEEIIAKYYKKGMVLQHPKDPQKWGYWELVAPQLEKQTQLSVAEADQKKRLDKADKKK